LLRPFRRYIGRFYKRNGSRKSLGKHWAMRNRFRKLSSWKNAVRQKPRYTDRTRAKAILREGAGITSISKNQGNKKIDKISASQKTIYRFFY